MSVRPSVDADDSNFDFDDNNFDFAAVDDDVVVVGMDLLVHDIDKMNHYYTGCRTRCYSFHYYNLNCIRPRYGSNLNGLDMVCFCQFRLSELAPLLLLLLCERIFV